MTTPATLIGLAVGDALGMPFERPRDGMHPDLGDWTGKMQPGTYHKLPAGHWTDDTEMAVALAESLIEQREFNGNRVARAYFNWSQGTPHGMGRATRQAMEKLAVGAAWHESGTKFADEYGVGSGTVMRCAPLGVVFPATLGLDVKESRLALLAAYDASITHNHDEAITGSIMLTHVIDAVIRIPSIQGERILEVALSAALRWASSDAVVTLNMKRAVDMFREEPAVDWAYATFGRTGQVISLLPTALFCAAAHVDRYSAGVTAAVRGGGDTDTRAAVVGAILGARNGMDQIPDEWLSVLHEKNYLIELDEALNGMRGQ